MLHPRNELIDIIPMYFFAEKHLGWASWRTNFKLILALCDLARIMIPPNLIHNLELSKFDICKYISVALNTLLWWFFFHTFILKFQTDMLTSFTLQIRRYLISVTDAPQDYRTALSLHFSRMKVVPVLLSPWHFVERDVTVDFLVRRREFWEKWIVGAVQFVVHFEGFFTARYFVEVEWLFGVWYWRLVVQKVLRLEQGL